MAANLDQIVEELSTLSLLEAADLVKKLEEKWGVSAAAPVPWLPCPALPPLLLNPSKRRLSSMW